MKLLLALIAVLSVSACEKMPTPAPVPTRQRVMLDWEPGHPERSVWSAALLVHLDAHYDALARASDAALLHPQWNSLSRDRRLVVLAELLVWTAYYESGWDPRDSSIGVGTPANRDSWSVGLLQLSVVDQANHGLPTRYSFGELEDPIKNIDLGVALLASQVVSHGKILIPAGEHGVYWSTLHPGGKYDRSSAILAHTRSLVFTTP